MLRIYGSMLCKDCVQCREDLDKAGVAYQYLDFADDLMHLKEFMKMRDTLPVFATARQEGKIGIPWVIDVNGEVSLDWTQLM